MIEVKDLVKTYKDRSILDGISFSISKGEILAIIGPSGGGKSTILRCINGLELYDSGVIEVKVKDKSKISMVFQHFNLFHNMTIMENLCYAPMKVLKMSYEEAVLNSNLLLGKVGLGEYADYYPHLLSGGSKQRAAIARALCMQPEVILFDEPTSALDPENVKEVLEVIKGLANTGITMIIVTHEMRFAANVADNILFVEKGKSIEQTSAVEFFDKPKTDRAKDFLMQLCI